MKFFGILFAGVCSLFLSTFARAQEGSSMQSPYYSIAGLGSSEGDSTSPYPYPMAVLQPKDTLKYQLRLRFPSLGILGSREDTVFAPIYAFGDSLLGYRPRTQLFHFSVPVTPYVVFADVLDKQSKTLLESRPLPYNMNVEKFASSRIDYVYDPQTGMGNPLLRRRFIPKLLPFSLESNPGWVGREQFDTSGVYSLSFFDPTKPEEVVLSVSMRPASIRDIDSASWAEFKSRARIAFGDRGVPVSSVGEFLVTDEHTQGTIKAGYEMVAKRDSTADYVAAYLTPKAIILLMAPLQQPTSTEQYDYVRAIARSFILKKD